MYNIFYVCSHLIYPLAPATTDLWAEGYPREQRVCPNHRNPTLEEACLKNGLFFFADLNPVL
jgi:hypothetical protein